MKIRLIALMSLAGVIALSGCTVGPDYKRPTLDVPLEYRQISKEVEDNAQWLTARWWTQYQDPAIDALVSSAIKKQQNAAADYVERRESCCCSYRCQSRFVPAVELSGRCDASAPEYQHCYG